MTDKLTALLGSAEGANDRCNDFNLYESYVAELGFELETP